MHKFPFFLGAILISTPSFAQEFGSNSSELEANDDAIVVTARKRNERIVDVPLSISALGASDIEEKASLRLLDLANSVPNLVNISNGNDSLSLIVVRGVASQSRVNAGFDSGVGVYVDGVVQGKLYSFNQELFDTERVEFLRGPQGTLFGRNSIAGAISITTRKPQFEFGGDATAQLGSYDERRISGFLTGPVVNEKLAVSIGGFRTTRRGYITNVFDGRDIGNIDSVGGRIKALWRPNGNVSVLLSADYTYEDQLSPAPQPISGYGAVTGRYKTNTNLAPIAKRELFGVSGQIDWTTSADLTLTSITAFRTASSLRNNDPDLGPLQVVDSQKKQDQWQFSQELRLAGNLNPELSFVSGLYYFKQEVDGYAASTFGNISNVPAFLRGLNGFTSGTVGSESFAGFLNADWEALPRLTLTLGARLTYERQTLDFLQQGFPFVAPSLPRETDAGSDTDFSPLVTLRYKLAPSVSVYATASRGYKSGGWNLDNVTSFSITSFKQLRFNREQLTNYEVGLKGDVLNGGLGFAFSAFQQNYGDIQTAKLVPVLGGGGALVAIVSNAASARIRGFEGEVSVRPFRPFTVVGTLGYADARFKDYRDATAGGTPLVYDGNRIPNSPELTASLTGILRVPVDERLSLGGRVQYSYVDGYFQDRDNSAALRIPSRDTVDMSIEAELDEKFRLAFNVSNVFNNQVPVFVGPGGFGFPGVGANQNLQLSLPRMWNVRGSMKF
ncbi:TonB-dependent receptor [Sphingosinicella microcystinivorans]|uniref:Iron complex outermembrane receptor protein n=1 Tax=Sphingosinicella microcystinivorans TaxID=335406 RepID=A0AAD1D2C9_SPHMI|nr:TonB-dependent receptor [Sphingosinicella microcystinivorans]RKS88714.1 iron complex outermembrane receptor protein [Sphingosinicella microcystinivorans]BBE32468.1 TonB-dependent receptor [Sphingosinicella microcystinivorans]